jgi:hypothetical protein
MPSQITLMNEQRHVIKRQVLELQVQGSEEAWQLQQELSRIYRRRIIPLIDHCCSELSAPDRLYRIDFLELDLGNIDPGRLESDLVAKVEAALRPALAKKIGALELDGRNRPDQQPQVRSQLELFALFARTGSLPWWADPSRPRPLEESLQHLLKTAPDALRRLLIELVQERRPLPRIVTHFDDAHLDLLAALLTPAGQEHLAQDFAKWIPMLGETRAGGSRSLAQLRRISWEQLLIVAAQQRARQTTAADFYRELLPRLAIQLGADYTALAADIRQQISRDLKLIPPALRQAVEPLNGEQIVPEIAKQPVSPLPAGEPTLDINFSDGDALYIANAGLVILWPFLENFFSRLGLLQENQFVADEARQRAVGLLQFLATDDPDFPEYQLPLNKILCGQEPDALFDLDPPLTDEEAQEGNSLLQAVIAQAPILRDMSIMGLRGTFLLRQGALRTRDGAWLLQVERETHDVVLDRFPWSWAWIKLPWMAAPLQVEW